MSIKRLTRREFMRIAALASAGVVVAACAPQVAPTTASTAAPMATAALAPTAAPTTAATSAPTSPPGPKSPSGTLSVALSTFESETFLPWNGGVARQSYLLLIYDVLVYSDPVTDEQMPGLAETWEMSPDGKTWTFSIRKGVQFHENWGELTAEDLKYSVERMIDKNSIGSPAAQLRSLIDKVDAPEPYKCIISLKSPYPELVRGFFNDGNAAGIVVSKKYVESVGDDKANAHPIGTAPFTLAEPHQKGGPIKLTTIPNVEKHWRITPAYQNVTFLLVPEESTRVAMLKNGEADLAPISYDDVDTIKSSGLRVISIPQNWVPLIWFGGLVETDPKRYNPNNPWVKKEVRQALNYAVDRETIAKTIFHGEATPAGVPNPIHQWLNISPYPYDVAKAKQLLASAGYTNGFSITLKTLRANPGAELPTIGEAVAQYWKAIGVDVKIVPSDWTTVRGELIGAKANDYAFTQRGQPFLEPLTPSNLWYDPKDVFAAFATTDGVDLLNKMTEELDSQKRDQLAMQMGQWAHDEASGVFLLFANDPYGVSKKVGHWTSIRMRPQNIESITPS